jgi:ABC-type phosphate transport system permease subunit
MNQQIINTLYMIVGMGIIGIVVSVGVIGFIKMWNQINKIKNTK